VRRFLLCSSKWDHGFKPGVLLLAGATNGLAMWITIVVALSSSAVLFVSVGTCIYVLHHRTGREDGNILLDFEGIATSEVQAHTVTLCSDPVC
jgi:hypothetical protein